MAGYREFQTGEVLTSQNVNSFLMNQAVMVFADDAARTTALSGVITEGMLTYNLDTKALEVYDGTAWGPVVTAKEKRIEAFTGSGTWTVPAGVTYAIARIRGGGGGGGSQTGTNATAGGASSVAFASGTVSAEGGAAANRSTNTSVDNRQTVPANSGIGGGSNRGGDGNAGAGGEPPSIVGLNGGYIEAGASVTPAEAITVTVGAGGQTATGGTSGTNGASGLVVIEYYEEV